MARRPNPAPSTRTRVKRVPENARYDRATVDAILDAALICHLGFVHEAQPFVIPTLHARVGDEVYVHGSAASRTLRTMRDGIDACLTATLLDGIVLARSVFEHSVNYRSVVVLGRATAVEDADEKLAALEAFSEKLLPGRWADARRPTAKELKATSVLRLPARRGVGQGARRPSRRRRLARRRARHLGGRDPARGAGAPAGARSVATARHPASPPTPRTSGDRA